MTEEHLTHSSAIQPVKPASGDSAGRAIELVRVVKRYGATTAVNELTLGVDRGQMFGLIGPDGAGKTTSIRLICGLLHPDAGEVRVLGRHPVREHRQLTEHVG